MQASARLFSIEDVVSVLTGAPLNYNSEDAANDLLSYVSGQPVECANGLDAVAEATSQLREQLPTKLGQIRISDLARVVIEVKCRSGKEFSRELVIRELRYQFGAKIPVCSGRQFRRDSEGLKTITAIVHECFQP